MPAGGRQRVTIQAGTSTSRSGESRRQPRRSARRAVRRRPSSTERVASETGGRHTDNRMRRSAATEAWRTADRRRPPPIGVRSPEALFPSRPRAAQVPAVGSRDANEAARSAADGAGADPQDRPTRTRFRRRPPSRETARPRPMHRRGSAQTSLGRARHRFPVCGGQLSQCAERSASRDCASQRVSPSRCAARCCSQYDLSRASPSWRMNRTRRGPLHANRSL